MTVLPPPNIKFGRFLFAPILERDGLPLTVLSAFTRLDLDPWQEAARLSELPQEEAINSLAAHLWKTTSAVMTADEASERAAHLILLLPREHALSAATAEPATDLPMMWVLFAIFFCMIVASGNQPAQMKTDPSTIAAERSQPLHEFRSPPQAGTDHRL